MFDASYPSADAAAPKRSAICHKSFAIAPVADPAPRRTPEKTGFFYRILRPQPTNLFQPPPRTGTVPRRILGDRGEEAHFDDEDAPHHNYPEEAFMDSIEANTLARPVFPSWEGEPMFIDIA